MATATQDKKEKLKNELVRNEEIELTVIGRKTGRKSSRPVWFVVEGDRLYLLPVKGSDSEWFKNILKNPRITISAGGQKGEFTAQPVHDPNIVVSVVDKFRKKYGASEVKKYYSKFDVVVIVNLK
jgi:deazaflavin-dependent oxidoreductase (nitroreductase family)